MEFSILMNNATKSLHVTKRINLRQHENLVDKLVFIVPYQYNEDTDLRDFNVCLQWLDPSRVVHVDILEPEEEVYKDNFQRYFIPVDSLISKFAGEIEVKLVFTKTEYETGKRLKLETGTTTFEILPIKDYYVVAENESFDAINDAIDKLRAQTDELIAAAEIYNRAKADSHVIGKDGKVYLTSNGNKIGKGLNLVSYMLPDEEPEEELPDIDFPTEEPPKDENPGDEEPKDDVPGNETPGDENPDDDEPKDDIPSDENQDGEEPKDDEPSDENPDDEDQAGDDDDAIIDITGKYDEDEDVE